MPNSLLLTHPLPFLACDACLEGELSGDIVPRPKVVNLTVEMPGPRAGVWQGLEKPFGQGKTFPGAPQSHRAAGSEDSLGHALARTKVLQITHSSAWPGFLGSMQGCEMSRCLKSGLGHQRDSHGSQ